MTPPLKRNKKLVITRATPMQEIVEIFAALMQSINDKNGEFETAITTVDDRHKENYKSLQDLIGSIQEKHAKMTLNLPEDGYTPVKGKDYFDGRDGYTPVKGKDYFDGERGEKGDNGSPDTSDDIRNKLELLDGDERLSMDAIRGLREELSRITRHFQDTSWLGSYYGGVNQLRIFNSGVLTGDNGVKNINFVGATIVNDNQGDVTVTFSGGGGGGFNNVNEIVAGSGTSFTLANTPTDSTKVCLYGGGSRLTPGAGNDYTISGKSITMANSYSAGQVLADYSS